VGDLLFPAPLEIKQRLLKESASPDTAQHLIEICQRLVARPWARKFLGFSFTSAGTPKRRIAPKAVGWFKERNGN